MGNVAVLDVIGAVQGEVAEIKADQGIAPDQPVKYEPMAWTRQGRAD